MRRIESELKAARQAKQVRAKLGGEKPPERILPRGLAPSRVTFPYLAGSRTWDWSTALAFCVLLLGIVSLLLGAFIFSAHATGFGESLDLYFRTFEFNGSLYPIAAYLGSVYKGWNWIAVIGPALSLLSLTSIIALAAYRQWRGLDLAETLLWCFAIYLLCATTVHPWYFVYLIGLGSLTRYRWPMVLGVTGFLSYAAYGQVPVVVPVWALVLEYGPVLGWMAWELNGGAGRWHV